MSERLSVVLARWWHRNPNRPASRRDLAAAEIRITQAVKGVSDQVSEVDDAVSELNEATNDVADKLDANTAEIERLTEALANAEPGSAEAEQLRTEVANAVSGMRSASSRMRDLASDPENPVPPVEDDGSDGDPLVDTTG